MGVEERREGVLGGEWGSGVRGGLGFRVRWGYGEWPAWWPSWAAGVLGQSPGVLFLSFLLVLFSILFLFFLFIFLLPFYF